MRLVKYFSFIIFVLLIISCSKEKIEKSIIKEKDLNLQVLEAYSEGMKALETGDVLFAAKNLMRQKHYSLSLIGPQEQH